MAHFKKYGCVVTRGAGTLVCEEKKHEKEGK
jgi:hypothetical protein